MRAGLLAVALLTLPLAGCGLLPSGSKRGDSSSQARTSSTEAPSPAKPVGPPPARESVEEAERRIRRLASSSDCDVVNRLNLLHRPDLNTAARCESLQRLAGLNPVAGATYGAAAVIDYSLGIRSMSLVLVRQPDGLFHVLFPDYFVATRSVGTKYAHQFDAAAKRAVKALRIHRCGLFLANANRELGPGSLSKSDACGFVRDNPVATIFGSYPEAAIDRLGGNQNFGFFGISAPGGYFTLVFAREMPSDYLPQGKELPKGAPTYGFAGLYLANAPQRGNGPKRKAKGATSSGAHGG
jgi:hypothetical protein